MITARAASENAYNRHLGDQDNAPNPCLAPITQAPDQAARTNKPITQAIPTAHAAERSDARSAMYKPM